jgi:2-keto-4-pentenoate hydratase/2-oxohepta-3-ene-1,7-dioic acid hydratase in catechol pathway
MATSQWMMGKTFAPMGPAIVTADEIEDPHNLNISLTLNGQVMQNSNTRHLIFDVPKLIADLSSVSTLEPGDVISTGTPAGVGLARKPPGLLEARRRSSGGVRGPGPTDKPRGGGELAGSQV